MTVKRFTFNRTALRDLPVPDSGSVYYYDESVRGLVVAVWPSGAKSFLVYRKFKGKPLRIALGIFDREIPEIRELPEGAKPLDLLGGRPSLNVRMARKLATAVIAQLDVDVNPAEEKQKQLRAAREELTLGELFNPYKAHLVSEGKKGVAGVVWYWERYLGALPEGLPKKHGREREKAEGSVDWEFRPLSTITRTEVSRLRTELADKISPTTANRVMELLCAIFNFGIEQELFHGVNPAKITKFRLQSRERRLEAHEARAFFAALNAEDDDFQDYVRLSLFTGQRRSNVLRMRWDELNFNGAGTRWARSGELMKNGDPLTTPLVAQAVAILKRRFHKSAGNPWVFPGNTPEGHAGPFRVQWEKFREKAGVSGLWIHDLRRTLGSWMSDTGANTVMTMRALGHKSMNAALIYQRLSLPPVHDAMAAGVKGLLKAAEPKAKKKTRVVERSRSRAARVVKHKPISQG